MGLYDAMNASVTGMAAQSNYLANIGQNISNSGTVGYKEADTQFSTLVDQAAVGETSAPAASSPTRVSPFPSRARWKAPLLPPISPSAATAFSSSPIPADSNS